MERFSESASRLAGLAGALLGWRPDEFWRATPAELGAVLGAMAGAEPGAASRSDLDRLMERFPDQRSPMPANRSTSARDSPVTVT